jgi:uncharacterized cupin superfamily protein
MNSPIAIKALDVPVRTKPSVYPKPFSDLIGGREKHILGDLFGLSQFGVNLTRLKPEARSALRHFHEKQDEFIYILEGEVTLLTNEGQTVLSSGMCAGFKANVENGHCLINLSKSDVVYLEIGDRSPEDIAVYPDDDLMAKQQDGVWVFNHKDGSPY